MRYLVTGREMKCLDQNTILKLKLPEMVLIEQAAISFVDLFLNLHLGNRGIVFCGTGNNGADGIAIARLLNQKGVTTEVCKIKEGFGLTSSVSDSYKLQEAIYDAHQYPMNHHLEQIQNTSYDFVVDAFFGIGLSGPLDENYCKIIEYINGINGVKVGVDVPSGVNSDNGHIMGSAVSCDYTITFSYEKLGMYLWPGYSCCGKILVAPMGIRRESWMGLKPSYRVLEETDIQQLLPRPEHSHKGTFGKLLLIAGSRNMAGAAILAGKSAYHNGVGLVKVVTDESNREILQTSLPEAIVVTYQDSLDKIRLHEELQWADAVVIGPGLGKSAVSCQLVDYICTQAKVPVLIDADGINILAESAGNYDFSGGTYIITPHIKEFSRLTGHMDAYICDNMTKLAEEWAKERQCICVLKDFHTVITSPGEGNYMNLTGNNGMATAGSGDVLSGIIGAFLAQGLCGIKAASYGVLIHGMAGDKAKETMGTYGMTSSSIIEGLKEVWNIAENK